MQAGATERGRGPRRTTFLTGLAATPRQLALYTVLYLAAGLINNWIGRRFAIAEFAHEWQVLTCYG